MRQRTRWIGLLVGLALLTGANGSAPQARDRSAKGPDRVYFGQSFEVPADQSLGSVVVIGGSGVVRGEVRELVAIGSRVDLTSTAKVDERLVSFGSTVNRESGAQVRQEDVTVGFPGPWTGEHRGDVSPGYGYGMMAIWVLMSWLIGIALGVAFHHLFPRFQDRTAKYLEAEKGRSFGIGILGHLLLVPGALALVLTVIGIVLVPLYFVLYLGLLVIGHLLVGWVLGLRLLRKRRREAGEVMIYATGLGVLALLRLVPILGMLVVWLLSTAGFGAALREVTLAIRDRRTSRKGGQP